MSKYIIKEYISIKIKNTYSIAAQLETEITCARELAFYIKRAHARSQMTMSGACGVNVIQSTKCAHIIYQKTFCGVRRVNFMQSTKCDYALCQMILSGVQRVLQMYISSEKLYHVVHIE